MSEAAEKEAAPPLGQGRYRLLDVLGAGGMATVYRAHDRRLDVHRAIKVLTPTYASNPELRKRFLAEARVLAKLYHPNIVMCHDIGVDGDRLYIVMELVEGGGLWERMRDTGPLAPAQALDVMAAVLPALQVAHDHNVIHRDIKPGNILVGKDGVYKLADFGIARAAQQDDESRTRTGSMLGTPSYMAPEQWAAGRDLDARADVFAMGATLYSLVTLQTPQDIHINEMQDEQLRDVHPAISTIIRRACRYRANERYDSAIEMLGAVRQARTEMSAISANMTVGGVRKASSGTREEVGPQRRNIKVEQAARELQPVADPQRPTLAPTDAASEAPPTPAVSFELSFRPSDSSTTTSGSRPRPVELAGARQSLDGPSQVMRRPPEVNAVLASQSTASVPPLSRATPEPTLPTPRPAPPEPIVTPKQLGAIAVGLVVLIAVALLATRDKPPAPVVEAPAPVTPTPPVVAAPAPVVEAPAPVTETPPTPVTTEPATPATPAPTGPSGALVLECRPDCDIWIDGQLAGHNKLNAKVEAGQRKVELRSTGRNFRALKVVPADGEATLCYDFDAKGFCGP